MTTLSVIVPTYRRSIALHRCLEALKKQSVAPLEIIVAVRGADDETHAFFESYDKGALPLRIVRVNVPGVVVAMNTALALALGEIVALTDDDSDPHPDWIRRLIVSFDSDSKIGGVGGRDCVFENGAFIPASEPVVGKIQFFGRVVGNHHIGEGEARDVDVLKGVNCAYRRDVIGDIGFDKRLVGTGAQPHWELSLGIAVKKRGYRLVYDPAILVDHYPAPRHDEDQRWTFSSVAVANAAQNEAIALFDLYVSWRRLIYILWFLLIGVRDYPGLLQALRLLMHRERHVASRWRASMRGRIRALIGLFPR